MSPQNWVWYGECLGGKQLVPRLFREANTVFYSNPEKGLLIDEAPM
jgi:hypothetical protein